MKKKWIKNDWLNSFWINYLNKKSENQDNSPFNKKIESSPKKENTCSLKCKQTFTKEILSVEKKFWVKVKSLDKESTAE